MSRAALHKQTSSPYGKACGMRSQNQRALLTAKSEHTCFCESLHAALHTIRPSRPELVSSAGRGSRCGLGCPGMASKKS